jgi:hypothetical protein
MIYPNAEQKNQANRRILSYFEENGGIGEPRLNGRGGVEHGVAAVEGGGEGVRVGDVTVRELNAGGQAGDVAGAAGERAHGVPRVGQRRAQAAAQVPRRARHHHPHAAAGNRSSSRSDPARTTHTLSPARASLPSKDFGEAGHARREAEKNGVRLKLGFLFRDLVGDYHHFKKNWVRICCRAFQSVFYCSQPLNPQDHCD